MTQSAFDPLAEGLVYEGGFPLRWRTAEAEGSADVGRRTEDVLAAYTLIEEAVVEVRDEDEETSQELARLERKLNLLLDLVGEVLRRQFPLPDAVPVRIGPRGMEWRGSPPPRVGDDLHIELYLEPQYPRALELRGRVVAVREGQTLVSFQGLSPGAEDALERLIFLHHRRAIARARAGHP